MKTLVIPKDEMTPIERSLAIKTSKPYDRIPCSPMVAEHVIWATGISVVEYLYNPKLAAEAQAKAFDYFGYDSLKILVELGICIFAVTANQYGRIWRNLVFHQ